MNKAFEPVDRVVDELMGGRVVAYRALFAHCFGGATAGLLLSQFWYYSMLESAKSRDGWFDPSMEVIEDETGLTRTEQETARRKLRDTGVLEEARSGIPARLWFRLNKERTIDQLRDFIPDYAEKKASRKKQKEVRQERREAASLFAENLQTRPQETHKQGCGEPAAKQGQKPRTISKRDSEQNSESDSEQEQQAILPAEPPPSPRIDSDVVVEANGEQDEQKRLDADDSSGDVGDPSEENKLYDDGAYDAADANQVIAQVGAAPSLNPKTMTRVASSPQEILIAELVSEGMGKGQAKEAVRCHYDVAIYQLENLRHALQSDKILPSRGGWLYKAITTGYGPTKGHQQFLEAQKAEHERRKVLARDEAARQARIESERISFDEFKANLSPEEDAVLRQRARNCVHPDWRKRGEAKCALMVTENYKSLLKGEERMEYALWPLENNAAESGDNAQNGRSSGPEE